MKLSDDKNFVEAVARKLCLIGGRNPDADHEPVRGHVVKWWQIYEYQAIAAIDAVEEVRP